jgi:diadenylate cyclase
MWLRLELMTPLELIQTAVDILIVAYLFYRILLLIRNTRAFQLVKGVVALLVATQASQLLGLSTLHVVLQTFQVALLVALPVVFQPELRRALEQLGRTRLLPAASLGAPRAGDDTLDEVVRATVRLARDRVGALIALEQGTGLQDVVETGIPVDARLSWELIVNIFTPNSPLHDGAIVVRQDRILAAGCFLPLASATLLPPELGTRHRAAVGLSEETDAVIIVVSEETGVISLAQEGRLLRHLDESTLRQHLAALTEQAHGATVFRRVRVG